MRQRRARIKTGDDGNYYIGMSNGRVATIEGSSAIHTELTALLDRIEVLAEPSPQKLARIGASAEFKEARRARHEERVVKKNPGSAVQVGLAPKKNPGKMMWEMVLLGRRIGPV